ncbi:MAG: cell division protein ZapA [Myxococcota bacterium]
MKRSVQVEIAGQSLSIVSDEGERYVQQLADYVDEQVREIGGGRTTYNPQRVALLVAIRLADELLREKDLHRRFREQVARKLEAVEGALADHEATLSATTE